VFSVSFMVSKYIMAKHRLLIHPSQPAIHMARSLKLRLLGGSAAQDLPQAQAFELKAQLISRLP
jgi:hypothetical protein